MKYFLQTYSTTIFFYLFIILVELYVLFIIQTQYQERTIQIPSFSNKMVEPPSDDRTTPPSEDVTTPPPKNVTTPPPLLEDVTLPPNDTTTTLLSDDSQETTENNTGKIILLLLQIFLTVCMVTFFFMQMQPVTNEESRSVVHGNNIHKTSNLTDSHTRSNIEKKVMFYMRYWVYLSIVGTVTMITSFVLYSTSPLDVTNFVLAWIYFVFDVSVVIALYFRYNKGLQKIVITNYVSSQNCSSIIKMKPDHRYKNYLRKQTFRII